VIYAIGTPAGLDSTITSGIVSALGRRLLEWGDAIQIDAALNPGNSGGPLLDGEGQVVGIVFAGMPQFEGLNFAIPLEWVLRSLPALYMGGKTDRAWLGLMLTDAEKGEKGVSIAYRHPLVAETVLEGERILAIDGIPTNKIAEVQSILLDRRPGDLVSLRILGSDGERTVLRALGTRPDNPLQNAVAIDTHDRLFPALLGMSVKRLPGGVFAENDFTVSSIRPGSIADEAGLSADDPFTLYRLVVEKKEHLALIQIHVKKKKSGYLESIIQIPVPLDTPDFV
jgi:hypothetical protein